MRERLLEAAVTNGDCAGVENVASRMVQAVSMFGCAPGCAERSIERQGLGHIRYQTGGQRELLVCSLSLLSDMAGKLGMAYQGDGFFKYLKGIMDQSLTKEALELVQEVGGQIFHHLMKPGHLMYLPVASCVWERTVGDQYVVGFRNGHMSGSPASVSVFANMVDQHKAALSDPENSMVKVWDLSLGFMKGGKNIK